VCILSVDISAEQHRPRDFHDDHVMANDVTAAMLVCNGTGSCEETPMTSATDAGVHRLLQLVTVTLYGIICGIGAVGNTVVIAVIVLSSVMRSSVTNIYIVNLAVSDFCFLAGLPLLIVTVLRQVRRVIYCRRNSV